jgi:UDP-N-acetylmuramate dehydrogenase
MITLQENVSLQPYNTFGLDVSANYFYIANNVVDLQTVLLERANVPLFILGGGSNILLTQNFSGLVIKNNIKGIEIAKEDDKQIWLQIGAGVVWQDLVAYAIAHQYAGIENLSLIPGTVGAAPIQNIGAYGVELTEVFDSLCAVKISDGSLHHFNHTDCRFGYRDSIFKKTLKNQFAIVTVILRLNKKPQFNISYGGLAEKLQQAGIQELTLQSVSDAVIAIRRSKLPDPAVIGNAGSFFKNPIITLAHYQQLQAQYPELPQFAYDDTHVKIPAAWLIERCGYKGKRLGPIGVHQHQALVLVNEGGGSGHALLALAREIQQTVQQRFLVQLEMEVNII